MIRSEKVVESIAPVYGTRTAAPQGGSGGLPSQEDFPGDPIVAIAGVTGSYLDSACVGALKFATASGRTFGPYGTLQNVYVLDSFDLRAPAGCRINSFFGTATEFIASLGGNVLPM